MEQRRATEPSEDAASENDLRETQNSDESEEVCPLFMTGLPKDFTANPALAALASLQDEEYDQEDKRQISTSGNATDLPSTTLVAGGGKAMPLKSRELRRTSPYGPRLKGQSRSSTKTTTIGEAQLFLNMWNLKSE